MAERGMSLLPQFADALLQPEAPLPEPLRSWNGSDPARRFDVHRNNVMTSLVRALQDGFPVIRQLVGDEFFDAMARTYVRADPPASPVLLDYGAGFAAFVDGFEPAASLPYLGDMARLERARVEAFHAADADAMPPGDFHAWQQTPDQLMQCRLALHPSLRVLRASCPVLGLWQAHAPGHESGLDAALDAAAGPAREDVLVLRPELEVHAQVLGPGLAPMLLALAAGATLGDALERAARNPGFVLDAALALLVHEGATVGLIPEGSTMALPRADC
jgi:hypothetical protein